MSNSKVQIIANSIMSILRSLIASIFVLAAATSAAQPASPAARTARDGKSVALNHFYVVLDEVTFAALRDSEELRTKFAVIDTGLPKFAPAQPDSQRLYMRGQSTYMEFLGPRNPFNEPIGKVGIALGVDELVLMDDIKRAWSEALGSDARRHRVEWKRAEPPVPWYDVIQHPSTAENSQVVLWTSGYLPQFLPWLYPHRSARENGVARADFLAPQFKPDRLLRDVTGLTIALPAQLRDQIAKQLQALGYSKSEAGGAVVLQGGGWRLELFESAPKRTGLLSIDVSLNRETINARSLRVGPRSIIELRPGRNGRWSFE